MEFLRKIFNSRSSSELGNFNYKKLLGFSPSNQEYYQAAFTHKSYKRKDKYGKKINYERLEFLGDAVLGTVIADYLFIYAPSGNEGYLTQMRSKIVSRNQLNTIGRNLNLDLIIRSDFSKNQMPEDVFGDTIEALVGAIYLDKGYKVCQKFIYEKIITPYVDLEALEQKVTSYKSLLIEWAQKTKQTVHFEVCDTKEDDFSQQFGIKLLLDDQCISKGRAASKKKAEEQAAKRAYYQLRWKIDKK